MYKVALGVHLHIPELLWISAQYRCMRVQQITSTCSGKSLRGNGQRCGFLSIMRQFLLCGVWIFRTERANSIVVDSAADNLQIRTYG